MWCMPQYTLTVYIMFTINFPTLFFFFFLYRLLPVVLIMLGFAVLEGETKLLEKIQSCSCWYIL